MQQHQHDTTSITLAAIEQALEMAQTRYLKEGAGFSYGKLPREIARLKAERDKLVRSLQAKSA